MPSKGNVVGPIRQEILKHQVNLLRLEAGERRRVFNLLDKMQEELLGKLGARDITKFNKERVTQLLSASQEIVDNWYAKAQTATEKTLQGVAEVQASHIKSVLDETFVAIDLTASVPTDAMLAKIAGKSLIMGAPSEDWWDRQARDTGFRFANAVRQGLIAGDSTEEIVGRVAGRGGFPGIMDVSKSNARSLVHVSIMEVSNEARMETFQQNDDVVDGIRQVSTLDSHTTEICMAYDGAEFDLEGNPINGTELPYESGCPRHWGCRSVEIPITKSFKELGIKAKEPGAGERASSEGPVSGKWTFENFLDSLPEGDQDEILGPGRAELWRGGDITLQQLLDQKGNPLTLAELQDKYA
jgi:hypothetical protein